MPSLFSRMLGVGLVAGCCFLPGCGGGEAEEKPDETVTNPEPELNEGTDDPSAMTGDDDKQEPSQIEKEASAENRPSLGEQPEPEDSLLTPPKEEPTGPLLTPPE